MELTPARKAAAAKAIEDAANAGCCCDHLAVTHVRDASGTWHVLLEHDGWCNYVTSTERRP